MIDAKMISCINILTGLLLGSMVAIASAFQGHLLRTSPKRIVDLAAVVDISEGAPRDVASLSEWATSWGVQTSDCFQLVSEDGLDVYAVASQDVPEGSPILCVPNEVILTGSKAREEFGADAYGAEQTLMNSEASDRTSQFYLFLKVLKEYELGEMSPWYQWLNSLPRYFSNGASMTDFCFGCLPPYAAERALDEKKRLKQFVQALNEVTFISSESKSNSDLTRWAFSVVHTRCLEMPNGDFCLAPNGDFFNHGGAETDIYITYDDEGNYYAYSTHDVPAGQILRICYGDPTNPSNLLASYGFLDESSPATFCKFIINNPSPELINMGYDHSRMVFYNSGDIAQEVWDVLLYQELGKVSQEQQQAFYQAHMAGDEALKQSYHIQYFAQTLAVLQKHVNFLVNELDELGLGLEIQVAQGQDAERHPRLPLIMRHNEFVSSTLDLSPTEQQAFYQAHMSGDEALKQSYHDQYFPQTLSVLQKHVDYLVNELEELSENTWRKDVERHPRLPLLMRHNEFVHETFELVQQSLDNMSS
ncbi:hypothetical protein ACHAXR_002264 [Thalassiosira sp. AJA248-18]